MTERDIAESFTRREYETGLDRAEELVFSEYDDAYSNWNDAPTDTPIDRVTELEKSLIALRVARRLLDASDISLETLQALATEPPMTDSDIEAIKLTGRDTLNALSN